MAGAIKKVDVIKDDVAEEFKELNTTLQSVVKSIELLIQSGVDLNKVLKTTNKTTSEHAKIQKTTKDNTSVLIQKTKELEKIEIKTATALGKLSAEQTKQGKNLARINQQKQENARLTKLQNVALAAEAGSYKKISAELSKNLVKYKAMGAAQRDNTKKGKALSDTIIKQRNELTKLDAKLGNHTRNVGNYKSAMAGTAKSMLGAFGIIGGVTMFATVLRDAFQTVRELSKEQSILAGVLDKSVDSITELTDEAKRLGSVTAKTATEVTMLQTAYARLGFSQSEIINLTEATISGSIALNAELSATAELTGAVVNTFDQFGTMDAPKILDIMTVATQKSALNFEKLNTALPIVGGAANAAGVSFTRLVSLLGKLSDSGIDASSSATSLRNIFLEAAKNGEGYEDILDRVANSSDILAQSNIEVGKRAAVSATLLSKLNEEVSDLDVSLQDAGGAAKRLADEQLKSLDGRITLLSSAWDGLVTSQEGAGTAASFVVDIMTSAVRKYTAVISTLFSENTSFLDKLQVAYTGAFLSTERMAELQEKIAGNQGKVNDEFEALKDLDVDTLYKELESASDNYTNSLIKGSEEEQKHYELIKNALSDEIKKREEAAKKVTDIIDKQQASLENQLEAEIEAENVLWAKKEINNQKEVDANAKKLEKLKSQNEKYDEGRLESLEIQTESWEEGLKEQTDFYINELARRTEQQQIDIEAQNEADQISKENTFNASMDLGNALFEFASTLRDRELADIESKRDFELKMAGDDKAAKEKIDIAYDKKRTELLRKQAIADKTQAIINTTINTAVAVMKASAQTGVLAPVFAAIIGALGAVQIATIIAQPIPKFKDGVEGFGGGLAIVGDGGEPELISGKSGSYWSPASDTLTYLEPGASVTPLRHIQQELAARAMGGGEERNDDLINEIKGMRRDMKHTSTDFSPRGMESFEISNSARIRRIDTYFKR